MRPSITYPLAALSTCLLALPLGSCKRPSEAALLDGNKTPVVRIIQPVEKDLADVIEATGTFSSSQAITLIARVQGELQTIGFKDGDWVKKGQLLFQIDDASYVQQVKLYQAQLLDAQSEYDRQLALKRTDATSVAKVESWLSKRDQAQAQVELAKIDLGYTKVIAPFDARIGKRYVDAGNIVGPGMPSGDKIVDINATEPIYLGFDLSEHDLLRLRKAFGDKSWPRDFSEKVTVEIALADDEDFPLKGVIDFVDTSLSTSTGTIRVRATLPNPDNKLIPGLFARIRIPVGKPSAKLLVPDRSVANDQQGDFVMTVGDHDMLVRQPVAKGARFGELRAVSGDITTKTRVVAGGQVHARAGVKVEIRNPAESAQ